MSVSAGHHHRPTCQRLPLHYSQSGKYKNIYYFWILLRGKYIYWKTVDAVQIWYQCVLGYLGSALLNRSSQLTWKFAASSSLLSLSLNTEYHGAPKGPLRRKREPSTNQFTVYNKSSWNRELAHLWNCQIIDIVYTSIFPSSNNRVYCKQESAVPVRRRFSAIGLQIHNHQSNMV